MSGNGILREGKAPELKALWHFSETVCVIPLPKPLG